MYNQSGRFILSWSDFKTMEPLISRILLENSFLQELAVDAGPETIRPHFYKIRSLFAELRQDNINEPAYVQAGDMLDEYAMRAFQKMVQYYALGADTQYRNAVISFLLRVDGAITLLP